MLCMKYISSPVKHAIGGITVLRRLTSYRKVECSFCILKKLLSFLRDLDPN